MSRQIEGNSGRPTIPGSLGVEVRVREADAAESMSSENKSTKTLTQDATIRALVLCAVMAIAGIYVGTRVNRSWIAVDDGTLAQSAARVLDGQLPHRDFSEIYTGGLSLIHAEAFHLFGVNLRSLRICVFLFFLAWLPAVYYIALRFAPPLGAGMVTLLAVAWSFPNYPAAMPSWYNLFFATFGAAALLRYLEVRTRKWLFIAGFCGGVSILIKAIGTYYIAGVLLFLAFLEQSEARQRGDERRCWTYHVFSASALILFLCTLLFLLRRQLAIGEFYHFVLPATVMVGLILAGEREVGARPGERIAALLRSAIPFVCGVLTPVAVFLFPYALSGSLVSLFSGVTSSTISHVVSMAEARPASPQYVVAALPLLGLLAAAMYWKPFQGRAVGAAIALLAGAVVVCAMRSAVILTGVWLSVAMLTPMVIALGAVAVLSLQKKGLATKLDQQRLVLLLALAATCTLVQFPFSVATYLCYSLPLAILALAAIVTTLRKQRGTYVLCSVASLYLAFGVVNLIPLHIAEIPHAIGSMSELRVPRGGIQIEDEAFFEDLTHFLQARAPNGLMYAGNECPELYFLTGLKNVTRDDWHASEQEVLKALQSDDLKLVVITELPNFPGAETSPRVQAEVMQKFPNQTQKGIFHIFWRQ